MLKITTTFLVIIAILSFPLSHPLFAQSQMSFVEATETAKQGTNTAPDLKTVIARNQKKYRDVAAAIDVKALEKIDRQTQKGNGLTGRQKTYIVLGVIALAALVFVAVKYGKDCKTYSPAGCSPSNGESCTCTEYYQNL